MVSQTRLVWKYRHGGNCLLQQLIVLVRWSPEFGGLINNATCCHFFAGNRSALAATKKEVDPCWGRKERPRSRFTGVSCGLRAQSQSDHPSSEPLRAFLSFLARWSASTSGFSTSRSMTHLLRILSTFSTIRNFWLEKGCLENPVKARNKLCTTRNHQSLNNRY